MIMEYIKVCYIAYSLLFGFLLILATIIALHDLKKAKKGGRVFSRYGGGVWSLADADSIREGYRYEAGTYLAVIVGAPLVIPALLTYFLLWKPCMALADLLGLNNA